MRLRAYDTVHVSSVRADNLKPNEEFDIDDAAGEELMKAHPGLFARVSVEGKAEAEPQNKAEPAPENKTAEPVSAPTRRGVPRR